jgi:cytochrome c oxidase subunit 2
VAAQSDALNFAITAVAVFFSAGIFLAIIFFSVKYRRGAKVDRSRPPQYSTPVELVWTLVPLAIAMGIFAWSTALYFQMIRVPANAMEISVVGKQWMWKLQQPNGRWEMNELHVPVGRPVVLRMTSEDVIHSFFVPAFRLKQDVIPGTYTQMWFTPTKVGRYHLYCTEFCGTLHSTMVGSVYVMEQADYERWLAEGKTDQTAVVVGERLFRQYGCSGCHGAGASVRAPLLEGIYNKPIPVQVPPAGLTGDALRAALRDLPARTIVADTRYLHDSIVLPNQEIAAGYPPIMPSFQNRLTQEEITQLVAYLRSLGTQRDAAAGRANVSDTLGADDYRARVGFVPDNVAGGRGGAAGTQSRPAGRSPESFGRPGAGR